MDLTTPDVCAKTDVTGVAKVDANVAFDAGAEQPAKESTPEVTSDENNKCLSTDTSDTSTIEATGHNL